MESGACLGGKAPPGAVSEFFWHTAPNIFYLILKHSLSLFFPSHHPPHTTFLCVEKVRNFDLEKE